MRFNFTDREINEALETATTELGHFDVQHEVDNFIHTGKTYALREFLQALPEEDDDLEWPESIERLIEKLEETVGDYATAVKWLEVLNDLATSGADIQIAREMVAELGTTNERIIATLEEIVMSDRLVLVFFENGDYVKGTPKHFTLTSVTLNVGDREFTITKGQVDTGVISTIYRVPSLGPEIGDNQVIKNIKTKWGTQFDFGIRSSKRYILFLDNEVKSSAAPEEIVKWEEAQIV